MFEDLGSGGQEDAAENKKFRELRTELKRCKWWLNHSSKQLARLWELLESHLDDTKRREISEQLGRNCAKSIGWGKKYKGNPEGFFKQMERSQGEKFEYDKANGIITVTTPERDCVCKLVNSKLTPAYFCHCSMGWQKHMYETILDKSVETELKESVLQGSKRCVFQIRIKQEIPI
jgi:predicted hydrocarbon binding protein